jgi:4-hydroxy-4-methyl-2-oxoglutarate aldolase
MSISKEIIRELSQFSTATLHEALGQIGNLPYQIKPLSKNMKICGRAYTVKAKAFMNINFHRAYAYAEAGDVIVADCSGGYEAGYWGDLLTTGAMKKGIAGLVIDGCVRDADEIEALGFPVFCRGLCIKGTGKNPEGSLNEPITIGEVTIHAGDFIVGDRDGVIVIPKDRIEEAIEKATARETKEAQTRAELNKGLTSLQIYGWDKKFGY